jgi:hypothetical protein
VFIAYGRELGVPERLQLSFTWMMPASLALGITTGTLVSWAAAASPGSDSRFPHADERNSP